ncbi:MAG: MATE family efflux transporter [Eubacteriales bacterium]|nr:MATE family efflux transporter [Eubacteriales bacterium]
MMKDLKSFIKMVLVLVVPIALQNLINVGVTAADVLMLGKVSEEVLSGASLGGQVQFIMTLIYFGLTSGASVLVAQYWGKKDIVTIEKVLAISIRISFGVAVLFTVITFAFPEPIMKLLSSNAQVVEEGVKYLRIVCFSYIFTGLTMVYLNILRSVENVVISTFVYLISLIINIIGNALLIFGMAGFPKMGIQGAAIATLFARICEFVMVVYYDRRRNKIFKFKLSMLFESDKALTQDFIKFSMPVVINELMWGSGVAVVAAIIGQMGSAASAANSIAQVVRQLAMVLSLGVASAAAIIIGKTIGEGKLKAAKAYADRLVIISIITGVLGSAVVMTARPAALATMTLSDSAAVNLSAMMFVMSYFVIGQAYNTTMVVGIFRAGGDTKFGLLIDVGFMWCVSIAFGAIGAFVLGWSVPVVYMILLSDEIIKLPFTTKRYLSGKWLRDVTR